MAIAATLGTIAVGVAIAWLVVPSDRAKPATLPASATITIAATPRPAPTATPSPVVIPTPTPVIAPRRKAPHRAPTIASDPDAETVITTNSW